MKDLLDRYLPQGHVSFKQQLDGMLAFITDAREQLRERILDPKTDGFECCRFNTRLWDAVIQKIYEIARHQIGVEPDIAIYAVGSYGRQELCYYSDIDLVYTSSVDLEDVYDEKTLELIRRFYDSIDELGSAIRGLKFNFIYRPFVDIDRWNYQDITALIDMRFLVGDASLTAKLKDTVRSRKYDISIVLDLLNAKEKTFKASDDTIYLNQPNVKEGRGGLRTLQYALWMFGLRNFVSITELYDLFDDGQLKPSLDFMLKVRNLLHLFADAPQDILSYHPEQDELLQREVAQALGYGGRGDVPVYALMADYYACAKYLHFKAEALIGNQLGCGIHISKALGVKQSYIFSLDNTFETIDANELFQLFSYFQRYNFEIDPSLATFIFTHMGELNPEGLKAHMAELMAKPGAVSKCLTRMHRLGIMEHILPEFERAMLKRSERSTDPYTVGKHTLVAIGYLDEIRLSAPTRSFFNQEAQASELGELSGIYQQVSDSNVLYMALLLHDIDKPNPEHASTAAKKARRIASEFGFNEAQINEICFLIREHLTMINLARYHQWDEETIAAFHRKVKSLNRLMQLYLLTYCDSKANGDQNFTSLDKDNLKRLYELLRTRIVGHEEEQWCVYADPNEFRRFLQQMPVSYRMIHSPEEIALHIRLVKLIEAQRVGGDPVIHFADKTGYTELHLCSYSRVGNMRLISGLFFAHHIDVREARTYTKGDTKAEIEIYRLVHQPSYLRKVQPIPLDESLKKELVGELQNLVSQGETLEEIFAHHHIQSSPEQWRVYDVQVNATPHKSYSEIVVKGEERIGFLYFFSGILASLGLNIEMCKCSGLGGKITNRFYIAPIKAPEAVRERILERLK